MRSRNGEKGGLGVAPFVGVDGMSTAGCRFDESSVEARGLPRRSATGGGGGETSNEVVEEAVDDTTASKREGLGGLAREPFLHLSKQEEVRLRCLQYIAVDFKLYSHQHSCNNNHLHARSTYMLKTSSLDT